AAFEKTMEIAKSLGLKMASEEILSGVALHHAMGHSFGSGSTVITKQDLVAGCSKIIGKTAPDSIGDMAVSVGLLARVESGYQVYGAALQEAEVATFLVDCLRRPPGHHAIFAVWERHLTEEKVVRALSRHEKTLGFTLTAEQRAAIVGAVLSPVCGISGGAGTGKTTILKAIIAVYSELADSLPVYQVALSGRAAQRMSESTGLPAQSIAKLIADHVGQGKKELPSHLLLIIDEASMVDLLSMYRLTGILPDATRIIFVGDTEQLPPVGAGLIFHSLTDTQIPFFNLSQVKRQADESAVHTFAMSIRTANLYRPEPLRGSLSNGPDCVFED
ncbi:MAG: AAA family ATPase, partial [Candidatus Thiodiazotropha endolucinida]